MPQTISRQKTAIIVFTLPLTLLFVNECNLDVPVNKKMQKKGKQIFCSEDKAAKSVYNASIYEC